MIHPKVGFHEVRETDPVIEKIAVLMRLQQLGGESCFMENLPEFVLRMRVIRAGFRGRRPHGGPAKNNLKGFAEQVVENVRHLPTG